MGQCKVIICIIDVGGDKYFDYLLLLVEENLVLGLCGICFGQVCLELFDQQLCVLLRVELLECCWILLLMVSEVDELCVICGCFGELVMQLGIECLFEFGVMIEVFFVVLFVD